ncbi:MAG: tyrosine--tRNA ligase [Fastidiosipilaceae bacterium]|jgi:tyrosyl-tRNA synthetase
MNKENIFDVLNERGYIAQTTNEEAIRERLSRPGLTFYIGFDPTADSLHVGHFVTMMVMAHMQRAGHRPIALLGGGTGMIGDPSGRSDLRQVLSPQVIQHNVDRFREQMKILIDFDDDRALMVNNADWLIGLNYIEFIREIGSQFSVNRMLAAECYKQRYEKGLTFLEFNYMLLQAYDFLELYRNFNCEMQLGGDDQWSNILAGIDLIRRKESKEVHGMTFNLLTTSEGSKMGKTAKGAVWLDPEKTAPFDFYQYWRNVHDADVITCLKLLTFVPMPEIREYGQAQGAELNVAKARLAYEVTKIVHGEEQAEICKKQAEALFSGPGRSDSMPTTTLRKSDLDSGVLVLDVLELAKLIPSRAEGRRLIKQGGIYVNDVAVSDMRQTLSANDFDHDEMILRKGKKVFHRVLLSDE